MSAPNFFTCANAPVLIALGIIMMMFQYLIFLGFSLITGKISSQGSVNSPQPLDTYFSPHGECRVQNSDYAEEIFQRNMRRRSETYRTPPTSNENEAKSYWFSSLYPCFGEERVGDWVEGGKWVCRPKDLRGKQAVVYSVGSHGESSFEYEFWKLAGVKVFTFDPTLNPQLDEVKKMEFINFYPFGVTDLENETAGLEVLLGGGGMMGGLAPDARMLTMDNIMKHLGHTYVDVLKMDCEKCEFGFVDRLLTLQPRHKPLFGQILVETHTVGEFLQRTSFFEKMEKMGYRLFHVEPNFMGIENCAELAYIHESLLGLF